VAGAAEDAVIIYYPRGVLLAALIGAIVVAWEKK